MIRLLTLLLLSSLTLAPARAQTPATTSFSLTTASAAPEQRTVLQDLALIRWPGAELTTGDVKAGDVVDVILRDGELVRVRKGTTFGWLPATALGELAQAQ